MPIAANLSRNRRALAVVAAAATLAAVVPAFAADEWLSLGSKEWAPTVTSKSGIGTANAMAEAKVTRNEIEGWCANWSPGDKGCVARELARPEAKLTYRASADCTRGRITPVDGQTYTLAGVWDNSDIGAGRTRWRDSAGKIVGRDNASGGLAISQQWEAAVPRRHVGPCRRRAAASGTERIPCPVAAHRPRCRTRRRAFRRRASDRGEVRQRVDPRQGRRDPAGRRSDRTAIRVRRAPRQREAGHRPREHAEKCPSALTSSPPACRSC